MEGKSCRRCLMGVNPDPRVYSSEASLDLDNCRVVKEDIVTPRKAERPKGGEQTMSARVTERLPRRRGRGNSTSQGSLSRDV
jgi:hypothetical protein